MYPITLERVVVLLRLLVPARYNQDVCSNSHSGLVVWRDRGEIENTAGTKTRYPVNDSIRISLRGRDGCEVFLHQSNSSNGEIWQIWHVHQGRHHGVECL